uniref:AtpZ/AtpI family protein n=1 Tax=Bacillus sp. S2-R3J1-FB-BA1 TaxID=1973490 RepID=UPI002101A9C3
SIMSCILAHLVGYILVVIFGGQWIDNKVGTFPFFLIIGLLLGLGTGVYATIRLIRHYYSGEQ